MLSQPQLRAASRRPAGASSVRSWAEPGAQSVYVPGARPAGSLSAEHPFGLVVVGLELGPPVGELAPLRVVEELTRRPVQGVGVVEGTAADPGASQDEHP